MKVQKKLIFQRSYLEIAKHPYVNVIIIWNQNVLSGIWFLWSLPYVPLMVWIKFREKSPLFSTYWETIIRKSRIVHFGKFYKILALFEKVKKSKLSIFSLLYLFQSSNLITNEFITTTSGYYKWKIKNYRPFCLMINLRVKSVKKTRPS